MNGPGHLRRLLLAACLALACSLLPAVPAAAAAGPKTYVGKVEGTDAYIALAVRGDKVKAYVCDAKDVSRWLDGTLARARKAKVANGVTIRLRRDGARYAVLRGETGDELVLTAIRKRTARGHVRVGDDLHP